MFDRSAHVYDLLYGGMKGYAAEAEDVAALVLARNPAARTLLDVACGTGEHLSSLAADFDEVAGVDVEPGMLAVARTKLPGIRLETGDMRTFDLGRTFDAVVCLFSSVGYMASTDELDAAIGRMAAHLAPGGVVIVDGWIRPDAWHPGVNVHALSATGEGVAAARVARTRRDGARTTLDFRYQVATAEGFEAFDETHVMTLFTDGAYRAAFDRAGLAPDAVEGPMGPDRDRYVAVRD